MVLEKLTPTQELIFKKLKLGDSYTYKEISDLIEMNESNINKQCKPLIDNNYMVKENTRPVKVKIIKKFDQLTNKLTNKVTPGPPGGKIKTKKKVTSKHLKTKITETPTIKEIIKYKKILSNIEFKTFKNAVNIIYKSNFVRYTNNSATGMLNALKTIKLTTETIEKRRLD